MARIGVEQSLTNVQNLLRECGREVVPLKQENDVNDCDCCVITRGGVNVLGVQK